MAPRPPVALTNTVSWRSEGIKHRKNEIFLDVVEKLNLLVSSNGMCVPVPVPVAICPDIESRGRERIYVYVGSYVRRAPYKATRLPAVSLYHPLPPPLPATDHQPPGTVLHSEIIGAIRMKSFLSGMPELKLGLNDKLMFEATGRSASKGKAVELEDIKFHQCVRLAR